MSDLNKQKRTSQSMDNLSFDETYDQNAVELLVENTAGTALVRQKEILQGLKIPEFDYIALTYVVAGNGAGEIETVVYKINGASGTIVATLTLSYNGDNAISSITKS